MNRQFLTDWQLRRLNSTLFEVSASWKIDELQSFNNLPIIRVETKEERDISIKAIDVTLSSLHKQVPNCLAIVGLKAIEHLPQESRKLLNSAPHEEGKFVWLPGDEDFAQGESFGSMVVEFGLRDIATLYPFFLGLDPRCLLLFSRTSIMPSTVVDSLTNKKDHHDALKAILDSDSIVVFSSLDGDILVFIVASNELLTLIIGAKRIDAIK